MERPVVVELGSVEPVEPALFEGLGHNFRRCTDCQKGRPSGVHTIKRSRPRLGQEQELHHGGLCLRGREYRIGGATSGDLLQKRWFSLHVNTKIGVGKLGSHTTADLVSTPPHRPYGLKA